MHVKELFSLNAIIPVFKKKLIAFLRQNNFTLPIFTRLTIRLIYLWYINYRQIHFSIN